jgi:hypothetical protein
VESCEGFGAGRIGQEAEIGTTPMHFCHEELFALVAVAGAVKVFWLWATLRARPLRRLARAATRIFSLTIHTCSRLLPGACRSGKKAPEEHHV